MRMIFLGTFSLFTSKFVEIMFFFMNREEKLPWPKRQSFYDINLEFRLELSHLLVAIKASFFVNNAEIIRSFCKKITHSFYGRLKLHGYEVL